MLIFGKANAKLVELEKKFKKKVSTFSLLAGHTCPYAMECDSRVIIKDGKKKIQDGKHTLFRCFSASQEVVFPGVYDSRKSNSDNAAKLLGEKRFVEQFLLDMPPKTDILRWHVSGDAKTQTYFDAMIEIAIQKPNVIFYAYTKSLPFWVKRKNSIPENFVLTASYGGYKDALILEHNLRYSKVVFSESEAESLGLEIDHDDSHAMNPATRNKNFALLIHGQQPAGSDASKAIKVMKAEGTKFSYGKASDAIISHA